MDTYDHKGGSAGPPPGVGIAGLSRRGQAVAAVALAAVGVVACVHLGMVFLHVAPSNTASKQYDEAVDDWVYPEFEQNWKLFAPNPVQSNIAVQARAEVADSDGALRTTGWIDLSAEDGAAIQGSLLPSHVNQNALRRGWDFYIGSHDEEERPNGLRGRLSESYVRRMVLSRLADRELGGRPERVQIRSVTTAVAPPPWSDEKARTRPYYRTLSWWTVTSEDLPEGARDGRAEGSRE
ncbi:hypothetical protein GCM10009654_04200 [Streptomyces hebeiensis]|uniref:Uncharacterized protein n=1 Tax=Streptomyces hebeiensis TaxID=229486 RepID=A0ABN1UHC5_9ACTN